MSMRQDKETRGRLVKDVLLAVIISLSLVQVVSRSSDIGPGVKSGVKSGVSIHLVWDLYSYKIHAGHLLRFFIVIKHTIEICYMCMINIYCSMEFQTVSTSCTRNLYKMY